MVDNAIYGQTGTVVNNAVYGGRTGAVVENSHYGTASSYPTTTSRVRFRDCTIRTNPVNDASLL